jgi:hypothetical protein
MAQWLGSFEVDWKNVLQSSRCTLRAEQIRNLSLLHVLPEGYDVTCSGCRVFARFLWLIVATVACACYIRRNSFYVITHNLQYRQALKRCQVPGRDYASQSNSPYQSSMWRAQFVPRGSQQLNRPHLGIRFP